jgi:hypothetical protein
MTNKPDSAKVVGEPVAWMNPNESFSRDAFLWARDEDCSPEYNVPVYATPAEPAGDARNEIIEQCARVADEMALYTGYDVAQRLRALAQK